MRRKKFINRVKGMALERKVLTASAFLTLIACFMPWYGINSRVINEWWNAFGSIGAIAGYVVLAFSLLSLTLLTIPVLTNSEMNLGKRLPFRESAVHVFFQGQSFFVTLLFIPVYSQYSLINATNSGTRFGLYLALFSTLIGTIVAIAHHRKGEELQMHSEDFEAVPQPQRSIHEWEEEDQEDDETLIRSEATELEEEMFETASEPVAHVEQEKFSPYEATKNDQQTSTFDPYQ